MITKEDIQEFCDYGDYDRGEVYAKNGRVVDMVETHPGRTTHITCRVQGSHDYGVVLNFYGDRIEGYCTCPRFAAGHFCKHMVAASLTYLGQRKTAKPRKITTNEAGRTLLDLYLKQGQRPLPTPPVTLAPHIFSCENGYPNLGFTIGREKKYVVQNIENLARDVFHREESSYGKGLTFTHDLSNFDAPSQTLMRLLLAQFPDYSTTEQRDSYSYSYNYGYGYRASYGTQIKRSIQLQGMAFSQFFNLYLGQKLPIYQTKDAVTLGEGDPYFSVELQKKRGAAALVIRCDEVWVFFGDGYELYAMSDTQLLRCSQEFQEKVYPLVLTDGEPIRIAKEDLPTLCSAVLPALDGLASVTDTSGLVEQYAPDDCTPVYHFDWESLQGVVGTIAYQYGEETVPVGTPAGQTPGIKRNGQQEADGVALLTRVFAFDSGNNRYCLDGDEALMDFFDQYLPDFQAVGDVFLSQALTNKCIPTTHRAAVGVSVSGGLLTLNLDTGEFPADELEALYESMRKRKRYHKLRDGRFLTLGDSGYEKVAEIAHMMQLSPKELAKGELELSAYRGLYLDKVLEGSDGVDVKRNGDFRRMVRAFKSVAESDYQVPEGLHATLRSYQTLGFQWLKTLEEHGFGGILADEMGLGKTIQIIAFLLTVRRETTNAPSLIVCPASLVLNWAEEIARFAPGLNALVLSGAASARRAQIESDTTADVWVTSYDLLKRDRELYDEQQFYACVLDEAQAIKNQSTLVSKAVKGIHSRQRFVLTGTPIENRLSELWNLFDFLMPGYLFSHNAFVKKLEKPVVQSDDPNARRQLSLLVQPFLLRRLKADVLKELPAKIEHVRKIALSDGEKKLYQAAAHKALQTAQQTQEKLQILALLTHLRQLCCDSALCFQNYTGESSKLDACLELCQAMVTNGHQILLFSQFTSMLSRLAERLDDLGISHFTLEGATPKEKRAKLVKDFGAGKADVFLISLKAGGTGLNLTSADVVIHYDPWWNLAAQNQATDRAHRIGQNSHVQVYKLIAQGTIEEKILQLQEKKASLMDAVTGEANSEPLSKDEILALLEA